MSTAPIREPMSVTTHGLSRVRTSDFGALTSLDALHAGGVTSGLFRRNCDIPKSLELYRVHPPIA